MSLTSGVLIGQCLAFANVHGEKKWLFGHLVNLFFCAFLPLESKMTLISTSHQEEMALFKCSCCKSSSSQRPSFYSPTGVGNVLALLEQDLLFVQTLISNSHSGCGDLPSERSSVWGSFFSFFFSFFMAHVWVVLMKALNKSCAVYTVHHLSTLAVFTSAALSSQSAWGFFPRPGIRGNWLIAVSAGSNRLKPVRSGSGCSRLDGGSELMACQRGY